MELKVAIQLIEKAFNGADSPRTWADLGAGEGLFSRAISALLPSGSLVYAVDKSKAQFSNPESTNIKSLQLNFEKDKLPLDHLDGILMANSLHFVSDKITFIRKIVNLLNPGGKLVIVEYDMDKGNMWVPYPIGFASLKALSREMQLGTIEKMAEAPSAFRRAKIYSALVQGY